MTNVRSTIFWRKTEKSFMVFTFVFCTSRRLQDPLSITLVTSSDLLQSKPQSTLSNGRALSINGAVRRNRIQHLPHLDKHSQVGLRTDPLRRFPADLVGLPFYWWQRCRIEGVWSESNLFEALQEANDKDRRFVKSELQASLQRQSRFGCGRTSEHSHLLP